MSNSNQDDYQVLVAPFQALNCNGLQRKALQGLVDTLTLQQFRHLQSAIGKVDFHCDFLTRLPLDISLIILQYLPIHQVFQARRVSTQWREILSSTQTVEALLRDWYPSTENDVSQTLQIPAGLSAEKVASLKAEHIHAFRTGNSFSHARYRIPFNQDSQSPEHPYLAAFADGIIACVATRRDSHIVKTLDIKTGKKLSFLPEARTQIQAIAMSSSMVAILSSGRCYIWNLRTGASYYFRLPSERRASITVSGDSLALVYHQSQYETASHVQVVTWTLKDQRTSSFFLSSSPNNDPSNPFRENCDYVIMLDGKGETMLLLELAHITCRDKQFHYIRTDLDGNILARGSLQMILSDDYVDYSNGASPKEADGRAVIWSYILPNPEIEEKSPVLKIIYYNFRDNRLEVHKEVIAGLQIWLARASNFTFWKDVGYFLEQQRSLQRIKVIDLRNSTCSEIETDNHSRYDLDKFDYDALNYKTLALLDETFFVTILRGECCVWCFDANVQMVGEDDDFWKTI